jgi:CubicO group peptidase (beta-lactamase class C family)
VSLGIERSAARCPVDPTTRFQAASLSKPVAAATALTLVDMGCLDLDEDLPRRIGLDLKNGGVTLRRALSHTAGLNLAGFAGYSAAGPVPSLRESLLGSGPANHEPLSCISPPGERWVYSGGGYLLVQAAMEASASRPFSGVAAQIVLGPLGMSGAAFLDRPPKDGRGWSHGHDRSGEEIPGGWRVYPEHAAAGLWCSAGDLTRFILGVQHGLDGDGAMPAVVARLLTEPYAFGFSLGFRVDGPPGDRRLSHTGSNAGFRSELRFRTGGVREGAVVMANGEGADDMLATLFETLDHRLGWALCRHDRQD